MVTFIDLRKNKRIITFNHLGNNTNFNKILITSGYSMERKK